MTQEEVQAIQDLMNRKVNELAEYGEDVLILMLVQHEPDEEYADKTRQLLYVGRGNYWARLGMAADFVNRQSRSTED
jgi:hypothetical protein